MACHGQHRRKWPPSASHEALRPAPSSSLNGRRTPEQADTIFGGAEGVHGIQNTDAVMMHHRRRTKECFEGHVPSQFPKKYTRSLGGGLSPINLVCQREAQRLMWGVRGAFPPATAMVRQLFRVFCSVPEHDQHVGPSSIICSVL